MNQQKESQIIQGMIAQSRQSVAQIEAEILRLSRLMMSRDTKIDKRGIPLAIQDLQDQIASLNQGIVSLEHRLPRVQALEQAVDTINANAARAQADQEAQAIVKRDAAMRQAALQRYTATGGDPVLFDSVWPSIRQQIAVESAMEGGEAAVAEFFRGPKDSAAAAVQSFLAARYGVHLSQGGE